MKDHGCSEQTLRAIDSALKAEFVRVRSPTIAERLKNGFAMLSDDEPEDKGSWWDKLSAKPEDDGSCLDKLSTSKPARGNRGPRRLQATRKPLITHRPFAFLRESDSHTAEEQDNYPTSEEREAVDNGGQLPFWQMTRGDYHEYKRTTGETDCWKINREYRSIIEQAVREGKPVDPKVLAEYSDLRSAEQKQRPR